MKKYLLITIILSVIAFSNVKIMASNGIQFIGNDPVSLSMGGTGIANPQSIISAVIMNPATLSYFKHITTELSVIYIIPNERTGTAIIGGVPSSEKSKSGNSALPSFGLAIPINEKIVMGLGVVGIGGIGSDFREAGGPTNSRTYYSQIDLIPAVGIQINKMICVGVSVPISSQTYDGSAGSSGANGLSVRLGAGFDLDFMKLGLTFKSPALIVPKHKKILDITGDGYGDSDLKAAPPMELGVEVSLTMIKDLVVSVMGKYIFWKNADGWKDMDWSNQLVLALGLQYKVMKMLNLRAGYNYGKNPVNVHNGFNPNPTATTSLQGTTLPVSTYEGMRALTGTPITEHHASFGVGIQVSSAIQIDFAGSITFSNSMTESSAGNAIIYKSENVGGLGISMGISAAFK